MTEVKNGAVFAFNIEKTTLNNPYYRYVVYTNNNQQIVIMKLKAYEEIGNEKHDYSSQFIRVEGGSCQAIIDQGTQQKKYILNDGDVIIIPAGTYHNIIALEKGVSLYTIYSPPVHKMKTIQRNKSDLEI